MHIFICKIYKTDCFKCTLLLFNVIVAESNDLENNEAQKKDENETDELEGENGKEKKKVEDKNDKDGRNVEVQNEKDKKKVGDKNDKDESDVHNNEESKVDDEDDEYKKMHDTEMEDKNSNENIMDFSPISSQDNSFEEVAVEEMYGDNESGSVRSPESDPLVIDENHDSTNVHDSTESMI